MSACTAYKLEKPICCAKLILLSENAHTSCLRNAKITNSVLTDKRQLNRFPAKRPLRDELVASPLKMSPIEHDLRSRNQSSGRDEPFAGVQSVCPRSICYRSAQQMYRSGRRRSFVVAKHQPSMFGRTERGLTSFQSAQQQWVRPIRHCLVVARRVAGGGVS